MGVNGCLFSVGDIDGMSQAALALLRDEDRLNNMAANGRRTAQDHFCTSRVIPLYESYYEEVLKRQPRFIG